MFTFFCSSSIYLIWMIFLFNQFLGSLNLEIFLGDLGRSDSVVVEGRKGAGTSITLIIALSVGEEVERGVSTDT